LNGILIQEFTQDLSKIDTDRFSVMATLRWGFGATSSPRQTPLPGRGQAHPRKMGRLGVKRVFEQLGFSHEESHGAEDVIRGSSPTTIMVPFWQRGAARKVNAG